MKSRIALYIVSLVITLTAVPTMSPLADEVRAPQTTRLSEEPPSAAASIVALTGTPGPGIASEEPLRGECRSFLRNDDGTYEDGVAWQLGGVVAPDYGAWAEGYSGEKMISYAYFSFTQTGYQMGQTADVYVWESDGENPGNVVSAHLGWDPGPIGFWPTVTEHRITVQSPVSDEWFVGFWGNWPGQTCGWFLAADENGPGGMPRTKFAPGIGYPTGWGDPNETSIWDVSALGIANELFHEIVCFENPIDLGGSIFQGGHMWSFGSDYLDINPPYVPDLIKDRGPVLVNPPGNPDMHSRVAIGSDGHMHVAWMREMQGGNWEIYYAEFNSNGGLISGPVQISDVNATTSAYPAIALDSSNDAHVIWVDTRLSDGNTNEVYYSKVVNGQDATSPDYQVSDLEILDPAHSGRLVLPPVDIGGSDDQIEHPDIAIDSEDNVYIVWPDQKADNRWKIVYQKQPNVAEPDPGITDVPISDNLSGEAFAPTIAIDASNNVHIAWRDGRGNSASEIYYQKQQPDGLVDVNDRRVSGPDSGPDIKLSSMPDIAVGSTRVAIAFMDKGEDPGGIEGSGGHPDTRWEIFLRTLDLDGNLQQLKRQSDVTSSSSSPVWGEYTSPDGQSMYPQVAMLDDKIHLTWHDYKDDQDNAEIYYTVLQSTCINPAPDCRVTDRISVKDMYPAIALDGSGNPVITYQAERGDSWEIYRSTKNTDDWVRLMISGSQGTRGFDLFRGIPVRDDDSDFEAEYFLSINLDSGEYTYYMAAQDSLGNYYETEQMPLIVPTSGVDNVVPESRMRLAQNDPNPFSGSTAISYTLPVEAYVELNIYDVTGRRVRNLVDGFQKPGRMVIQWDGRDGAGVEVGNGVYLCRLSAGGREFTKKMCVVR